MFDANIKQRHKNIMSSEAMRSRISKSVKAAYTPELKEWFSKHSKDIWNNWDDKSRNKCIRGFTAYNNSRMIPIGIVDENDNLIKVFKCCADACTFCGRARKRAGEILRKCDRYNKNGKRCKMFGYYWTKL